MTNPPATQNIGIPRARPLDLFYDLVFVYALTQITPLLTHPHGAGDYLTAILVAWAIAGMYNAFVWLTGNTEFENALDAWLMLLAMGGFFILALSIPTLGSADGIAFGLSLMLLNAINIFIFSRVRTSSAQAIRNIAPYNFLWTLLVCCATVTSGGWHWALWMAALAVYLIPVLNRRAAGAGR